MDSLNMFYRALIIFITTILTACISPTASVDKSFSLDPNSQNGLLVGSVKYKGLLSGYKVYFRGLNNNQTGYFEAGKGMLLIPILPPSDFSNINGKLQVTELPAGDYEISRWSVSSGYANLSKTQPFSIRFKIEPGKATYIGSFLFSVTETAGLTVTGVKVDFEDRYSEDITVLKGKYPNLSNIKIFMGLEPSASKQNIGGTNSTRWNMVPVFIPVGT